MSCTTAEASRAWGAAMTVAVSLARRLVILLSSLMAIVWCRHKRAHQYFSIDISFQEETGLKASNPSGKELTYSIFKGWDIVVQYSLKKCIIFL